MIYFQTLRKISFTIFIYFLIIVICNSQTITLEKVGRTYYIPCKVNGHKLKFILDTGADIVSISPKEAKNMMDLGILSEQDFLETKYFRIANGEIVEGTKLILKTVEIGGLIIKNIEATILHKQEAPMLFGQSALEKLGKVIIDYENHLLIVGQSKVIEANYSESWVYYVQSGQGKLEKEDYKGAILDFNKAIELEPSKVSPYLGRGYAKSELGDYQNAIFDYSKALESFPNNFQIYFERGCAKYEIGDFFGAISDLNNAIKINPSYHFAYNSRGLAKMNTYEYSGAVYDFSMAINYNPKDELYFNNRALVKQEMGDYTGSRDDFNKAIELNPNNGSIFLSRGILKILYLRDKPGACLDFKKAFQLGNSSSYKLILEYCY